MIWYDIVLKLNFKFIFQSLTPNINSIIIIIIIIITVVVVEVVVTNEQQFVMVRINSKKSCCVWLLKSRVFGVNIVKIWVYATLCNILVCGKLLIEMRKRGSLAK